MFVLFTFEMISNVKIIIFIAPDHWYDKKSMSSFTLENIGQWTMKIRFFDNIAYFFILLNFFLTVDFFPDGEKFCKILYLIVVKKNMVLSQYILCAKRFLWSKQRSSKVTYNGRCSILRRHKKLRRRSISAVGPDIELTRWMC